MSPVLILWSKNHGLSHALTTFWTLVIEKESIHIIYWNLKCYTSFVLCPMRVGNIRSLIPNLMISIDGATLKVGEPEGEAIPGHPWALTSCLTQETPWDSAPCFPTDQSSAASTVPIHSSRVDLGKRPRHLHGVYFFRLRTRVLELWGLPSRFPGKPGRSDRCLQQCWSP